MEVRYKNKLIAIILQYLPTAKIYLYGSRARGSNYPGSDVDLAIDAGQKIGSSKLAEIKEAIEVTTVPFFVDVVDVNDITSDFLDEIKQEWVLWR